MSTNVRQFAREASNAVFVLAQEALGKPTSFR